MDFADPDFLSPEQKLREQAVIARCFNLMHDERSRYEKQAQTLLASSSFIVEDLTYCLAYSIQGDRFICDSTSNTSVSQSFSIEVPIPSTQEEQIETLIELFAQSEAGLIL